IKQERVKEDANKRKGKVSLEDLFDQIKDGEVKDLNIVIKADVRGSIEAVKQSLEKLSIEEVKVNVIHSGVGGINENDVMLASASNAIIIGFNVRPTNQAIELSKSEEVEIKTYRIIYNAIEDIEAAVKGMLEPKFEEVMLGRAVVRDIFKVPNAGTVAGIYVQQGKITRNSQIRLLRNNVVVHEGEISSLKRYKDDVKEVNNGYEGGLSIHNYNDVKKGDVLEAFIIEEVEK
ncbi:MAG TPA: translation initiation factor IF-2, partial [Clostridiales bacterium]|nr:translation initiation factor IF-2 [Clostridiales bacterium]